MSSESFFYEQRGRVRSFIFIPQVKIPICLVYSKACSYLHFKTNALNYRKLRNKKNIKKEIESLGRNSNQIVKRMFSGAIFWDFVYLTHHL